jgi:cyclohexyl-isocyanide hydratase
MTLHIGLLVFPRVQQLDLTGPHEIFAALPGVHTHLVWKDLAPVSASSGMQLQPDTSFADCPQLDVICVPGGAGINQLLTDVETLDFLRAQAVNARYVTAVCTGALVLGAAGLLAGRRATTHWACHDLLPLYGAEPVRERVVSDGSLVTGGGVTAGIDFALTLAAELLGREAAECVQLFLEYAPAPPFTAGSPDTAPTAVVAKVRASLAPTVAERRALAPAAAGRPQP